MSGYTFLSFWLDPHDEGAASVVSLIFYFVTGFYAVHRLKSPRHFLQFFFIQSLLSNAQTIGGPLLS